MSSLIMHKLIRPLLVLSCFVVTACAQTTPSMYSWGQYEDQIYSTYNDPSSMSAEQQIASMEANIQLANASTAVIPPGFRAHLGYLYFQQGKPDQALKTFEGEKLAFPESTIFVDSMIARLKNSGDK